MRALQYLNRLGGRCWADGRGVSDTAGAGTGPYPSQGIVLPQCPAVHWNPHHKAIHNETLFIPIAGNILLNAWAQIEPSPRQCICQAGCRRGVSMDSVKSPRGGPRIAGGSARGQDRRQGVASGGPALYSERPLQRLASTGGIWDGDNRAMDNDTGVNLEHEGNSNGCFRAWPMPAGDRACRAERLCRRIANDSNRISRHAHRVVRFTRWQR